MIDALLRFSIARRWVVLFLVLAVAGARHLELPAPAHRRSARHHQRPGPDQHAGAGLLAAGSRTAGHLPGRDRHRGIAARGIHALACPATASRRSPSCSRTAPTSTSPAISSTSGCSRRRASCRRASNPRWGRSRPGSARSSCTPWMPSPDARQPDGQPYDATALRTLQDWIDPPAAAPGARRDRGQHHRRLREAVPRDAGPGTAAGLRPHVPRRRGGAREEQRQRRRGLHRAERRAVPDPLARPGRGHRRPSSGSSSTHRRRRADHRQGCGRGRPRQAAAHRRGHSRRQGNGAGHGRHADRREQPHRVAGGRRQTRRGQQDAAGRRHRRDRSTTAPSSWTRPSPRCSNEPARRRRCWWSPCCC